MVGMNVQQVAGDEMSGVDMEVWDDGLKLRSWMGRI
jgi:hypothetical protein